MPTIYALLVSRPGAGSVGLPMPGIDVGVVDEADRLLPAGQAGEVVVRGPNVMRGYLGRPEESAQVCAAAGCTPVMSAGSTRTAI